MMTRDEYSKIKKEIEERDITIAKYAEEHGLKPNRLYAAFKRISADISIIKVKPIESEFTSKKEFKANIGRIQCSFPYEDNEELISLLKAIQNV